MKYYTIDEAAEILKYTSEQTFCLTTGKDLGKAFLWPSAEFAEQVSVRLTRSSGKKVVESHLAEYGGGQELEVREDTVTGYFEIAGNGIGDLPEWDEYGDAKILHLSDGSEWRYTIPGGITIRKSQLRVSAAALEHFMELERKPVPEAVRMAAAWKADINPSWNWFKALAAFMYPVNRPPKSLSLYRDLET